MQQKRGANNRGPPLASLCCTCRMKGCEWWAARSPFYVEVFFHLCGGSSGDQIFHEAVLSRHLPGARNVDNEQGVVERLPAPSQS